MLIKHYCLNIILKNASVIFYGIILFIGSFLGWLKEIPWKIGVSGNCHASFMCGPFNPIYGFALCFVSFSLLYCNKFLHKIFLSYNKTFWGVNSYRKIFIDLLIIILIWFSFCLIETLTGLFLLHFDIRLWDYSHHRHNFYGVIAETPAKTWLKHAILIYFLYPVLLIRFRQTCDWLANDDSKFRFLKYLIFLCLSLFALDFIFSSVILFNLF